jgi:hypothetical protein
MFRASACDRDNLTTFVAKQVESSNWVYGATGDCVGAHGHCDSFWEQLLGARRDRGLRRTHGHCGSFREQLLGA